MVNTCLRWRGRRWTGEVASAQLPETGAATDGFHQVDVRESLRHALRQLTVKQRAVIMLRYFEDRTETETAAHHGLLRRDGEEPGGKGPGQAAQRAGARGRPDGRDGGMSTEEQRLSQLLKRIVPEPPFQLSADQITTHRPDRPARHGWCPLWQPPRSWLSA